MRHGTNLSALATLLLCSFAVVFPLVTGPQRWDSNRNTYGALLLIATLAAGLLGIQARGQPLIWTPVRRLVALLSSLLVIYAMGLLGATFGTQRPDLLFFAPLSLGVLTVLLRPQFLAASVSRPVRLTLLAFLVLAAATCLLTTHQHLALFGSYFRRTGFLTLLGCVLLFLTVVVLIRSPPDRTRIFQALVLGGSLVSLIAVWQFFDPSGLALVWFPYLLVDSRPIATMAQANWFATYLCLIFPLTVASFLAARIPVAKGLTLVASGLVFAAVLVCQTRGSWVAVTCFLAWLILRQRRIWKRLLPLMGVLSLVTVVLLPCQDWQILRRVISFGTEIERAGEGSPHAGSSRFGYWIYGLQHLPAHVVIGAGLDTYEAVGEADEIAPPIDKAHSIYLEYAIALGLAGLGCYLALLWYCAQASLGPPEDRLAWGLRATIATYLVQGIFIHDTIQSWPVLWVIAALAASWKIPLDSAAGIRNNVARFGNAKSRNPSHQGGGI